jgi:hypothetical protein
MTVAASSSEGLKFARLMMVLSSISPLFILWAIRGNKVVPDFWLIGICALMIVVPNFLLWLRIRTAIKQEDMRELTIGRADDHREHMLTYLFAMLLPLFAEKLDTWRELGATLAALAFIVFLFWHLNLHYINLMFAVWRFHIFSFCPPADGNPLTGGGRQVLITQRVNLAPGDRIVAYRISNTVYLEARA